jgi:hypothetical protein
MAPLFEHYGIGLWMPDSLQLVGPMGDGSANRPQRTALKFRDF